MLDNFNKNEGNTWSNSDAAPLVNAENILDRTSDKIVFFKENRIYNENHVQNQKNSAVIFMIYNEESSENSILTGPTEFKKSRGML